MLSFCKKTCIVLCVVGVMKSLRSAWVVLFSNALLAMERGRSISVHLLYKVALFPFVYIWVRLSFFGG